MIVQQKKQVDLGCIIMQLFKFGLRHKRNYQVNQINP